MLLEVGEAGCRRCERWPSAATCVPTWRTAELPLRRTVAGWVEPRNHSRASHFGSGRGQSATGLGLSAVPFPRLPR